MAAYSQTSTQHNGQVIKYPYIIENTIDASKCNGGVGIATGDVITLLNTPAYACYVRSVTVEIVTAGNKVTSATLGDASSAAGYIASVAAVGTGAVVGAVTGTATTDTYAAGGKLFSAATAITGTFTVAAGPMTTGVFIVRAVVDPVN